MPTNVENHGVVHNTPRVACDHFLVLLEIMGLGPNETMQDVRQV
jgi:hypothetical protein